MGLARHPSSLVIPPMVSAFTRDWGWVTEGLSSTAAASSTYETANTGVWQPIFVPTTCVATRCWWANGSSVSASYNVEAGIYLDAGYKPGAKLGTSGIVLEGTASQVQFAGFGTAYANPTVVAASSSSTDSATYTVASSAYTAGRMYLIVFQNTHGTSADAADSVAGTNITFTSRDTTQYNSNLHRVSMWTAVPSSNTTTTLTITFPNTQTACSWSVIEFFNVDTTTNHGIVQTATATGNDTAPTVTLSAFASSSNLTVGAIGHVTNIGNTTAGTGFVELDERAQTTPAGGHSIEYTQSADTSVDATVSPSQQWGIIGAEVKQATQPTYTLPPGLYWLYLSCSSASATFFRSTVTPSGGDELVRFEQASIGPGSAPATATPVEGSGDIYLFGFTTHDLT